MLAGHGQRDGAAGLDDQLEPRGRVGNRVQRLLVAGAAPLHPASLQDRQGQFPRGRGHDGVTDRPGLRVIVLVAAVEQATAGVVVAVGFRRPDLRAGKAGGQGQRTARRQPAAAAADDGKVEAQPPGAQLVGCLHTAGSLPGDGRGEVVGRHEHGPGLRLNLAAEVLPAFRIAVVGDDLGAQRDGVGLLNRRGVLGHDDGGRDPEVTGGGGDTLCVVAAGVGDDPAGTVLVTEAGKAVHGPAQLEGARALQVLALDEEPPLDRLRQRVDFDQRGLDDQIADAVGGLCHVFVAHGEVSVGSGGHGRPCVSGVQRDPR